MFRFLLIFLALAFFQNDIFAENGKVLIHLINRNYYDTEKTLNDINFSINRAHFGYRHQINDEFAATIVTDVSRPTIIDDDNIGYSEGSYYTMTLKFANIEWKPNDKFKVQMGSILQNHYITQEKFWGYRYIYETIPDAYFHIPSGDLGVIAYYNLSDYLSADIAITNGEGFKKASDSDNGLKSGAGMTFTPSREFLFRIYADNTNKNDINRNMLLFFAGYQTDNFRSGLELGYYNNYEYQPENYQSAVSIFAIYEIIENMELFARIDHLENEISNMDFANNFILGGIHYKANDNIALSLNYQGMIEDNAMYEKFNHLLICTEFKLN